MAYPVVHEDDGEYLTLVEVFHSVKRQNYGAGSHINLDHLDERTIKMLVGRKVVRHDPERDGLKQSDRSPLQDVKGISAAKAHVLKQLGITTVKEFLDMEEGMVAQVAESLQLTPDNIAGLQDKARKIKEA